MRKNRNAKKQKYITSRPNAFFFEFTNQIIFAQTKGFIFQFWIFYVRKVSTSMMKIVKYIICLKIKIENKTNTTNIFT